MAFSISENGTKTIREAYMHVILDYSRSTGDAPKRFLDQGLPQLIESLEGVESDGRYRAKIGVTAFSRGYEDVIPLSGLSEAKSLVKKGLQINMARSVTCPYEALEHVVQQMREAKRQCPAHTAGLIVIVCDGLYTDESGCIIDVPQRYKDLVASLNCDTHEPNIFAIGVRSSAADALGKGLADQLSSMGVLVDDEIEDASGLAELVGAERADRIASILDSRLDKDKLNELAGGPQNCEIFRGGFTKENEAAIVGKMLQLSRSVVSGQADTGSYQSFSEASGYNFDTFDVQF